MFLHKKGRFLSFWAYNIKNELCKHGWFKSYNKLSLNERYRYLSLLPQNAWPNFHSV